MKHLLLIMCVGVSLTACGDDAGLKGEPLRLNSLKGTYALNGQGCKAVVDESKVNLAGCQFGDSDITHDITGDGTLGESQVSYSGKWVETKSWSYDCGDITKCTLVTSGSASKEEGRTGDGPFSTFAGKWKGELSAQYVCTYPDKPAGSEYCDDEVTVDAISFDLDITGYLAKIIYSGDIEGTNQAIATEDFIKVDRLPTFEKQ